MENLENLDYFEKKYLSRAVVNYLDDLRNQVVELKNKNDSLYDTVIKDFQYSIEVYEEILDKLSTF